MPLVKPYKESELYEPVKKLFTENGYEVKGEVKKCDVVAAKGAELAIIELKLKFTLPLIYQALDRQRLADFVFVAIPRPKSAAAKSYKNAVKILNNLNIGLILVAVDSPIATAEMVLWPSTAGFKRNAKARAALVKEFNGRTGDNNKGGCSGIPINTVFREKCIKLACIMDKLGTVTPKHLINTYGFEKNISLTLSRNYYGWFEKVEKGVYRLSALGKEQINSPEYEKLAEYYKGSIK